MFGSTFGNIIKISTWGESHGKGIGVVVDGCPAGIALCEDDIQACLNRRKPGQSAFTTSRRESDIVEILSGVFEGRTTGTPISLMVKNTDQRSGDYGAIAECYRPGHADWTYDEKYGFRDYRGGGRSSGRETIGRVAAGAIAGLFLKELGIRVQAYTASIGPISICESALDFTCINENPLYMPDAEAAKEAADYLKQCIEAEDSSGGTIVCRVLNMPAGIGEPAFEKLDANLGKALLSIGAVKAVEIGDGVRVSKTTGLENNDAYYLDESGSVYKQSNHAGGILGGISDGDEIILKVHVKPTPSIHAAQKTVSKKGESLSINIPGRHDPIIVPRAVVVVEAMTALTLMDMILGSMTSQMDRIKNFFNK